MRRLVDRVFWDHRQLVVAMVHVRIALGIGIRSKLSRRSSFWVENHIAGYDGLHLGLKATVGVIHAFRRNIKYSVLNIARRDIHGLSKCGFQWGSINPVLVSSRMRSWKCSTVRTIRSVHQRIRIRNWIQIIPVENLGSVSAGLFGTLQKLLSLCQYPLFGLSPDSNRVCVVAGLFQHLLSQPNQLGLIFGRKCKVVVVIVVRSVVKDIMEAFTIVVFNQC
jgi:hypothetical protein